MSRFLRFAINLSQSHKRDVKIDYETEDGLAVEPADYTKTQGTAVFSPGETQKIVSVPIEANADGGIDFKLALSKPSECTLESPDHGIGRIGTTVVPKSSSGPIMRSGLVAERFHNDGGSFIHQNGGTAVGQAIAIEAAFAAHKALSGEDAPDSQKEAADFYKDIGIEMLDVIGGDEKRSPIIRQEFPEDETSIANPHWLFAARGGITLPGSAGKIFAGRAYDERPTRRAVYDGYSSCSPDAFRWFERALTFAIEFDERDGKKDQWTNLRGAMRRTDLRARKIDDDRFIIRPMPKFPAIGYGGNEPSGFYCWSDHPKAEPPRDYEVKQGANATWTGFNFFSREGLVDDEAAAVDEFMWTPENMNEKTWPGSIVNGSIKIDVPIGTEADANAWALGSVPNTARATVRLGKLRDDTVRLAEVNQQPDQFLFVAMMCNKKPFPGSAPIPIFINGVFVFLPGVAAERFWVYVSTTQAGGPADRYYADIGQYPEYVSTAPPPSTWALGAANYTAPKKGRPGYFLIPLGDFRRRTDNAVLPSGAALRDFGFEIDMFGPYTAHIISMRLVSGVDATWVRDNLQRAVQGDVMPFSPAATPFIRNADSKRQFIFDEAGLPFSGMQFPDYWPALESEIKEIMPDIEVSDLPVPHPTTGAIQYPIVDSTDDNIEKPLPALLMEQQLLFLQRAQQAYAAAPGVNGPFAHTYVLNTPARIAQGNPAAGTWIYTNNGVTTSEGYYQARVAESLGRLVFENNGVKYKEARTLATNIASVWLLWFKDAWIPDDVVSPFSGPPNFYPSPSAGSPSKTLDDVRMVSLVLRACFWLLASKTLSASRKANMLNLAERCWDFMEDRFQMSKNSTMRFTWGVPNGPEDEFYFGTAHFEIIATLSYMLIHKEHVPEFIALPVLRQRLAQARHWIKQNKVTA